MKIAILGSIGAGKTTLASTISEKMGIPMYCFDRLYFLPNEVHRRIKTPEAERNEMLKTILTKDEWILEGTYYGSWTHECFVSADVTFFLACNKYRRAFRIVSRYINRYMGVEEGLPGSLGHLIWLLKFNHTMDSVFQSSIREVELISQRFQVIKYPKEAQRLLNSI